MINTCVLHAIGSRVTLHNDMYRSVGTTLRVSGTANHRRTERRWVVVPRASASSSSSQGEGVKLNKAPPQPITLTEGASSHLLKLGQDKGQNPIVLRVGVKSGGCSGMSYVMDFVDPGEDASSGDTILQLENNSIEIRIDPKSLLYLFGLQLDYSDELIGGGFKFSNPNASSSCGCGTSFSV